MTFDAAAFLNTAYTEANDTKIIPIDEGEYQAIAGEVEAETWQSKDGTKSGLKVTIPWKIDSQAMREKTGREQITVRQDLMLDTLPGSNMLDMGKGKNVRLGQLREALGLNKPGVPFKWDQIPGKAAKVKVGLRPYEDRMFEEVKAVSPL